MKKTSRVTGLVAALMGATFLLMILGNPRVEALHVFPDVPETRRFRHVFGVRLRWRADSNEIDHSFRTDADHLRSEATQGSLSVN